MKKEDREFLVLTERISEYLEKDKVFTANQKKLEEFGKMFVIAKMVFKGLEVEIIEDPLEMGCLSIRIKGFSISLFRKEEKEAFAKLLSSADVFEIYTDEPEIVSLDLSYYDVFDVKIV